eukprot:c35176_g1_i1 orf=361-861(-)
MQGEDGVRSEALRILNAAQVLPRLVVFDLDYTLWPFWCECRSKRDYPSLYPQAKGVLNALKDREVMMAVASRSPTPDIARVFLQKLNLMPLFVSTEIYPSWNHKAEHFRNIQQKTGIPYSSMLFFDDEDRNTQTVSKMGVTSVLVNNGITLEVLEEGLRNFSGPSD